MSGNASCEGAVKSLLDSYEEVWGSRSRGEDQTTLFRSIVPHDEVDFTADFMDTQLDKIFTGERLSTKMMGNFNCNFLYRSSKEEYDVVVFSNDRYTVLHPMGEPGRDLGSGHGSKASHLMIVTHGPGPITFNELLPSSPEEIIDFGDRLSVMRTAVQNLRDNAPVSQCGAKVVGKAGAMGFNSSMGIREFMIMQIKSMPEDKRKGRPGYVLNNSSGMDVSGMGMHAVNGLVDGVFSNGRLQPFMCIQPPSKNTQLLSHIHCFMLDSVPELIDENYINCETLLTLKQEGMVDDEPLSRQSSTY